MRDLCSTFLPALDGVGVPDFSHSGRCVAVPCCCFNLWFPMTEDVKHRSMCIFQLSILFGEVYIQVLDPFFNWVVSSLLSFKSSLCILDNHPLSDVTFANIFSHSVAHLFMLLTVPFAWQLVTFFNHKFNIGMIKVFSPLFKPSNLDKST